jgi:hypothetical protein
VQHVSKLLRITPDSAAAVAARMPRLLLLPPREQSGRLSGVAKLLGVSQDVVRDVAALQPGLLAHPNQVLQ